jgi:hypothetical protein
MSLPILLLAGCGIWVVNEAIEIFTAGFASIVGTSGAAANACSASASGSSGPTRQPTGCREREPCWPAPDWR